MSLLADVKVHVVRDLAGAERCLQWVDGLHEPVSIDTETTGLRWWTTDFTRLIQIGTRTEGWAIPVREWLDFVREIIRRIVAKRLPIIFHNAKFDMHALQRAGCVLPAWADVHDTKILDHLLVPHRNHSLKPLAVARWGREAAVGQELLKQQMAKHKWTWETVPVYEPSYWAYGVVDTILTRRIWDELQPDVEHAGYKVQYEREMALQGIMYRAEERGLRIDPVYTRDLMHRWELEAVELAKQLERTGLGNPNSAQQIEACLRELGWEPDEFTATGQAVLNKLVKQSLEARFPDLVPQIMRYQRITKWMGVYLRRFLEERDETDHVHADINTLQARTGRMSITGIPLQTLPSGEASIRNCVLPDPGNKLWAVDYNSQEARLFVNYCKDPRLLKALRDGHDLYTYMAQVVYNDDSLTKDDPRRKTFKIMVLAWFYGAGAVKLALITGLPVSQVVEILERLFTLFPKVKELTGDFAVNGNYRGMPAERAAERFESEGLRYVLTSGGRRFSVPDDGELYKCVNGIMQGSGKDVLGEAVLRLDAAGLADNIVVPVHDELVFQFPDNPEGEEAAREAASLMEDHSFPVPLTTEPSGPLDSWGAKYEA